jgi:hypothetical protein
MKILPQTYGTFITKDGIYEGEFKNGFAEGTGIYTKKHIQAKYSGQWVKG